MITIDSDKTICLTRGDIAVLEVGAEELEGNEHKFQGGDVVRFTVVERNHYDSIVLQKEAIAEDGATSVEIQLTSEDTRIGEPIHKPKDFWYEVEVNPDTYPQTIIGHDKNGPKIFRLFPEGDDSE